MAQKRDSAHHCHRCGTVVTVGWHLPSSCKECGASFDPRPKWIISAVLIGSAVLAVLAVALVRLATTNTAVLVGVFLVVGFVMFNVLQPLLFKLGVLRLTNINDADDPIASIQLSDPDALAKAESIVRTKNYAGSSRETRAAQAKQLKESLKLAKSLRSDAAEQEEAQPIASEAKRTQTPPSARPTNTAAGPRCGFARVSATNETGIRRMSALATRIVREYFDPIIGPEQNDYMIERFQSPEAIAQQIEEGYEYYFVFPPKESRSADADGTKKGTRPIGFLALRAQENSELWLSKFYLIEEMRGKGYARSMMRFVVRRARELGCDHVTLRVYRKNYQAILAYEHLEFVRVGEMCTNIGNGFVMDDYVYELDF